jgi:WD40 repeat protein
MQELHSILAIPHLDQIETVAFSADDSVLATGAFDHKLRLFDSASGGLIYQITEEERPDGYQGCVRSLSFDVSGSRLNNSSRAA